jgi:predicted enzyme related to lactoylglutathione lyase
VIDAVRKVITPVDDQSAAAEFWTSRIGFAITQDEAYGGERWIEVAPPGGGPVLVLSPRPPDQRRPDVPDTLPHSPVFFSCADIRSTYRELDARGVRFPAPPQQMPFGWWSMFTDQDGTRYALGQWG